MILPLEKQVCSLSHAKKLKELGEKQESYFYWSKAMDRNAWRIENSQFFAVDKRRDISAFTVAELGEMLPITVQLGGTHYFGDSIENIFYLDIEKSKDGWCYYYTNGEESLTPNNKFEYSPEADARAKCLQYLLENKLMTL